MFFFNAIVIGFYLYFGWKIYQKMINWLDCCMELKRLKETIKENKAKGEHDE